MFVKRAITEIEQDFREAFSRLVRTGEAFDEGHNPEAANIAAAVYVFVHEGGKRSPSLLSLLNIKSKLVFINSAKPIDDNNLVTETPLVGMHVSDQNFKYEVKLGNDTQHLYRQPSFIKWWEQAVLRDWSRRQFSRKNLIHYFRHFRGGGHVGRQHERQDNLPAQAFADMANQDPGGWIFQMNDRKYMAQYGAEYASVRQIGWELERTLRTGCPDLIAQDLAASTNLRSID